MEKARKGKFQSTPPREGASSNARFSARAHVVAEVVVVLSVCGRGVIQPVCTPPSDDMMYRGGGGVGGRGTLGYQLFIHSERGRAFSPTKIVLGVDKEEAGVIMRGMDVATAKARALQRLEELLEAEDERTAIAAARAILDLPDGERRGATDADTEALRVELSRRDVPRAGMGRR